MQLIPSRHYWRAEGSKLWRQPLAWIALSALFAVLLASAVSAGLDARAWRSAAALDVAARAAAIDSATAQLQTPPGPAAAIAAYELGCGDLGVTRIPVQAGLGLGVQRLSVLPTRLKASLDNRLVESRDPGPLRNPLLNDTGLPGVPAMVALLLPLVALVLCGGLLQEEREHGRLGLLRVQSTHGMWPLVAAALGWRCLCIWAVTAVATLPALLLDPGSNAPVTLAWIGALAVFTSVWVVLGGCLSWVPVSGASSMLAALGLWLALTFAVPAALALAAERAAPMPSRLLSIVQIRTAQQESEAHEQDLAKAWYAAHPGVQAPATAVWPATFVARALGQEAALGPLARSFDARRAEQAAFVNRWAWVSPGLALVLWGEFLAGTDAASQLRYRDQVDAFEQRWRQFFMPAVMERRGLSAEDLKKLPAFGPAD